jgi:hypothetical protein
VPLGVHQDDPLRQLVDDRLEPRMRLAIRGVEPRRLDGGARMYGKRFHQQLITDGFGRKTAG